MSETDRCLGCSMPVGSAHREACAYARSRTVNLMQARIKPASLAPLQDGDDLDLDKPERTKGQALGENYARTRALQDGGEREAESELLRAARDVLRSTNFVGGEMGRTEFEGKALVDPDGEAEQRLLALDDAVRRCDALSERAVIEWWDDPDVDTPGAKGFNARYFRHRGCDEGDALWIVPQDGAPPIKRGDEECARCCQVFPLVAARHPHQDSEQDGGEQCSRSSICVLGDGHTPPCKFQPGNLLAGRPVEVEGPTDERVESVASELALIDNYDPNTVESFDGWEHIRDEYQAKARRVLSVVDRHPHQGVEWLQGAAFRMLDNCSWYVRCLSDVIAQVPVRALDEAEVGYEAAVRDLRAALTPNEGAKG